MTIVQLTTELRPAGAEVVILNLVWGLVAAGHRVTVAALQPLPPASFVVDGLSDAGADVVSLGVTKRTPWRVRRLKALLSRLRPDVLHAHLFHANLVSRLAGGGFHPLINTVHIAERRANKGWHFRLDRATLGRCDCQTAVSEAVRNFHAARLGVEPATIPVIYNGIEPPAPLSPEQRTARRKAWGVADCTRVIGSVGRLDWQKGYDRLLDTLEALGRRVPDGERWGLVIIGEGPQRPTLEALAAQAPPNVTVSLPGFADDAPACPGAFDLFVMPSRYEGFGLTLVEAMAHGVPILAADVDSLPELLRHYPNGECLDFATAAPDTIADRLVHLSSHPRHEPVVPFTTERMVSEYLHLYESVCRQE